MYLPLQPPPGPYASQETLFEWLKANCRDATLPATIFALWSYPLAVVLKYKVAKVRDSASALAADPTNNPARGGRVDIIVLEDVDNDCALFHVVLDTAFNTNQTGEWITGINPLTSA
jgi:hypothetical protein